MFKFFELGPDNRYCSKLSISLFPNIVDDHRRDLEERIIVTDVGKFDMVININNNMDYVQAAHVLDNMDFYIKNIKYTICNIDINIFPKDLEFISDEEIYDIIQKVKALYDSMSYDGTIKLRMFLNKYENKNRYETILGYINGYQEFEYNFSPDFFRGRIVQ